MAERKWRSCTDVWPIGHQSGSPPPGWHGWPGNKKFAFVLTHDVESRKGLGRCNDLAELETRMGFRSCFNFVADDYEVGPELRNYLGEKGFEVGLHGLRHRGNLFQPAARFMVRAKRINQILEEWHAEGFRCPSMYHDLELAHHLKIAYDCSTFDTDPFEPQPDGVQTIFPFQVRNGDPGRAYVELPYTLPQDYTLFVLLRQENIDIWKRKLDWIAEHGGMALVIVHPDYMEFDGERSRIGTYPATYYEELLMYVKEQYAGQYWNALPREVARLWSEHPHREKTEEHVTVCSSGSEHISIIDQSQDNAWDTFVENHPWGWITHLSAWRQVLERCFPHIKGHYLALVDEDNHIKAGLPLFSVKSWLMGNRLVSIPHATLCDPLVSNQGQMDRMMSAALTLAKNMGMEQVEIRTLMSTGLCNNKKFDARNYYKHHSLSLTRKPEELMKNFHRTCVRQRITRALSSELKVVTADEPSYLAVFYRLYVHTRRRVGLPPQPLRFFDDLWQTFYPQGRISLLLAFYRNQPVAALILFKFGKRISAEFAASYETFKHMSPNHLLFWTAIQMACREGYEIFDFGRTSPLSRELMDFKSRWGTTVMELPQYFYPRQDGERVAQDQRFGYKGMREVCSRTPEIMLPGLGRFFYSHIG